MLHPGAAYALIFLVALAGGCAAYQPEPSVRNYVVCFDSDALPHDPVDSKKLSVTPGGQFDRYVDRLLAAMDQWHDRQNAPVRKILIFIHGGLTPLGDATQDAENESPGVMGGGYYPIYINWDSGFLSSYGEHLVSVSQGRKNYRHPWARGLLSPFYLLADVGRAVTRIPVVWSEQIGGDVATVQGDLAAIDDPSSQPNWVQYAPASDSLEEFKRLSDLYAQDAGSAQRKQISLSIGDTTVSRGELAWLATTYAVTVPTKYGLSWILDGFGKSSWDNMTRRTLLLIDGSARNPASPRRFRQRGLSDNPNDPLNQEPVGGARLVIDKLFDHIRAKESGPNAPRYEITLVGHSMGSMVINELLTKEADTSDVVFKNIVYMAAACSVRDCARCVVPYLRAHPRTQFYNLSLHPTADLRERYTQAADLPPRGSLLVWIDEFLSDPPTTLDLTVGRWDNVLAGIREFPQSIRGQMTLKAFALRNTDEFKLGEPQTHSQFRSQHYWDQAFWQAGPPLTPASPLYQAVEQKIKANATE
jgi:pimeloyl-ACP methyl ester carboxylesterase